MGIQLQVEPRAVLKVDFTRGLGLEVARQIDPDTHIRREHRRQVAGLLDFLQLQQAGVNFQGGAGGVAETGQDIA